MPVPRRQRETRLEPLEFDTRPRASPKQTVGRLAQPGATLDRVIGESGVESGQESGDVALDPLTQGLIDKRTALSRRPAWFGSLMNGAAIGGRCIMPGPRPTWRDESLLMAFRSKRCALAGTRHIGAECIPVLRLCALIIFLSE